MRWLLVAIAACSRPPAPSAPVRNTPPVDAQPAAVGPDVVAARSEFRRCFNRLGDKLSGERLVLRLEVAASGDVTDAKMTGVAAEIATCIEAVGRRMHFPASAEGASFEIPFTD